MKSLKDVIIEKGFRISWIAIQLNITRYTLYKKINGIGDNTGLGADFSHYQLQKNAWKKVWKNYKGIEVSNVFEYVRSQGINTISVKVAVNPTKDKEGNESYLSLENAKKTLKEAKISLGFFL